MRILIVEDEPITALDYQLTLSNLGFDASQVVSSGEAAVRLARDEMPDCVVMDMRLAGEMSGMEAALRIRGRRDVPVVFVTAQEVEKKPDAERGFTYLTKPITGEQLSQAVRSALSVTMAS